MHQGAHELASTLRSVRLEASGGGGGGSTDDVAALARHPDGLGVLCVPPAGVLYDGPYPSERLRHALNSAVGEPVVRRWGPACWPRERPAASTEEAVELLPARAIGLAVERARRELGQAGFALEPAPGFQDEEAEARQAAVGELGKARGLLLFEPPGCVTPDAPGHWVAVRCSPGGFTELPRHARAEPRRAGCVRLDPVRGPFRLTDSELLALLRRCPAWYVRKHAAGVQHSLKEATVQFLMGAQ